MITFLDSVCNGSFRVIEFVYSFIVTIYKKLFISKNIISERQFVTFAHTLDRSNYVKAYLNKSI